MTNTNDAILGKALREIEPWTVIGKVKLLDGTYSWRISTTLGRSILGPDFNMPEEALEKALSDS